MQKKIMEFNAEQRKKSGKKLDFRSGDVVRVHMKIKEGGKERVQVFEGIIIAIKGGQSSSPTITVRKISSGVGVEMIIPVLSPNVKKIDLIKQARVRRAKLFYLRGLSSKQSRLKYKDIAEFIPEEKEKEAEVGVSSEGKKEETEKTE